MNKRIATSICICGWLLAACSGEEREKTLLDIIEQERAEIRVFLTDQARTAITPRAYFSKKGQVIDSTYLFNNTPPAATGLPAPGDFVLHDYSLRRLDGSYVESTDPDIQADTFHYAVRGPLYHRIDSSKLYDYIGHAFTLIAEGTSGELIVPSMLLDKSGRTRHYSLTTHRVIRDLFTYEKALVQAYVNALGGVANYQDGHGDTLVRTVVRVAGSGDRLIQPGDSVTFYRTCLVLRENTPLYEAFSMDTLVTASFDPARVEIPACGAAFGHLCEGDEAEIVIPYLLAFNDRPGYHPADKKKTIPWIPPYSTLIYAVKVAKVREKKSLE
ncbi:MAG: FKBP-type peptidyl-prolyl cis-trans isomerase [Odoribacteraceae bacterium]|jgi:hypothetical protein|nr:FKBP-type peptidyl-prolyl cis-trans isomerase [Odoribacteraceae bacterium]